MKQTHSVLNDNNDFEIIDLDDLPDRDTVKKKKEKAKDEEDPKNTTEKNTHNSKKNKSSKKTSKATPKKKSNSNSQKSSKKKHSGPSASIITTPVKKTVQTGAKLTSKLLQSGAKGVTLIMIAAIAFIIFRNFWKAYPAYGSLGTAINSRNYTLGAFLGVAAFLLIMELIFFFWAMTGPYAYGDKGTRHADSGRGLFSFLFIGVTVIAAGMFWNLIPSSPAPLTGLAGGLQLYGSLKNILLPLCGIGVVSCIVRKIFS